MVIYGHLKLISVTASAGDTLKAGDTIGLLGADKSAETSGERKHLHLGIHKGTSVNILGYVQDQAELAGWIDPCPYVCHS
jgi:murein DD-endopeptidase MepM/ murein hydrolase activator NlpD